MSPQIRMSIKEQMESGSPKDVGGVDLSDFASPPRSTQPTNFAGGGLEKVAEADDEDNIPGAKAIRANDCVGGAPEIHSLKKTPQQKSSTVSKTAAHNSTPRPKTPTSKNNGPRRLADTKPCSYPNLLITRCGDTPATSAMASNGPPSTTTTPVVTTAGAFSAAPDSISVNSANSSGSSSAAPKTPGHHHNHHLHHLHRQVSSGSNGKDSKCSIM